MKYVSDFQPPVSIFQVGIRYEVFVQSDNDYWRTQGERWLIEAINKDAAAIIAKSIFYKGYDPNSENSSWREMKVNVYDQITFPFKLE